MSLRVCAGTWEASGWGGVQASGPRGLGGGGGGGGGVGPKKRKRKNKKIGNSCDNFFFLPPPPPPRPLGPETLALKDGL